MFNDGLQFYIPILSDHIMRMRESSPHADVKLNWETLREVFDRITRPPPGEGLP